MQDSWRIICALLVVALHAQSIGLLFVHWPSLYTAAHHAVIVFFVISGFSVASAADRAVGEPGQFLGARLARVYATAIPALFLAVLLDMAAGSQHSDLYPTWQYHKWWLHLGFNALFLGELWQFHQHPFSIIPYWSLSYEVWYYLLLAATLIPLRTVRYAAVGVVFLVMGPKLWLLLPCWLFGVLMYHLHRRYLPSKRFGSLWWPSLLFAMSYIVLLSLGLHDWQLTLAELTEAQLGKLNYSKWFLIDSVVAAMFAATLWFTGATKPYTESSPAKYRRFVSWLAPHTYGIYLLHYTLLAAMKIWWFPLHAPPMPAAAAVALAILLSIGISELAERSRGLWRNAFRRLGLR